MKLCSVRWFFISMKIRFIFMRKVSHEDRGTTYDGNGLLYSNVLTAPESFLTTWKLNNPTGIKRRNFLDLRFFYKVRCLPEPNNKYYNEACSMKCFLRSNTIARSTLVSNPYFVLVKFLRCFIRIKKTVIHVTKLSRQIRQTKLGSLSFFHQLPESQLCHL